MQRRPRDDVRTEAELPPLPSLLLPPLPGVTEMLLGSIPAFEKSY